MAWIESSHHHSQLANPTESLIAKVVESVHLWVPVSLIRVDNTGVCPHWSTRLRVQAYTQQTGSSRPKLLFFLLFNFLLSSQYIKWNQYLIKIVGSNIWVLGLAKSLNLIKKEQPDTRYDRDMTSAVRHNPRPLYNSGLVNSVFSHLIQAVSWDFFSFTHTGMLKILWICTPNLFDLNNDWLTLQEIIMWLAE